ncbi:type IV secretory system conjugative DNA transfer family protein, partial [uncultured Sneathia sp.]
VSEQARDLIKPEEVRRFPLDKILLLVGGKPPIITKKILFFNDPRFKNKIKLDIEKDKETEHMKNERKIQEATKK